METEVAYQESQPTFAGSSLEITSTEPLPTRRFPPTSHPKDDLTGTVFGKLTAIGLAESSNTWVVKCECGRYTQKKARGLRAGTSICCSICAGGKTLQDRKVKVSQTRKEQSDPEQEDQEPQRPDPSEFHAGLRLRSIGDAAFYMYWALKSLLREGFTKEVEEEARQAVERAEVDKEY